MILEKIALIFEDKKAEKKKEKQLQLEEVEWQGYTAEKLMDSFYIAFQNNYSLKEWRNILEKLIFTLSSSYDMICNVQKSNGVYDRIKMVPMISERQILTYNSALCNLIAGDIWQSIHELVGFVKDFGDFKGRTLSELETIIVYTLCQQIVYQIRKEEKTG